ncbi:transcriptional regulator [Mycobacterium sp. ST-F2]|uniref:helix-turn-helix transcriptional regulator n=1 Tax=Mycobacterium sp. ST-F2 TaxID=1490484 RepID=UPI0009399FAF|nr:LuxR family transcriptional regulator [Mycobacterium sp. ST-F2]OKH83001.1 transcriptional regulator [Mycobacterium sp. ST-F2]
MSGLLPTGTVTLLLADVEGSTRLWETQPDEMAAAVAEFDRRISDIIAAHGGVRPVEQGEGDSFVAAFSRAGDAVACALELQRASVAPIRLRIGVHTGDIQLRDEGNYAGPTINRTARLRDLAHGGQTVLSGTTSDMVIDRLPAEAFLIDLGTHALRDLPRPERVVQLCHPDLQNDFPPLRTAKAVGAANLPIQLTSFVGREAELADVARLLVDSRLVTLTGAGGAGKTRLAIEVAARMAPDWRDGVCYIDLAPITDPDVVPIAAARTLGLPDQPGRSTMDALLRFVGDRNLLVVLDNCEHLLDASATLVIAILASCPAVTVLATSREPIGVPGEVTRQVPSLSLADEAVELFTDRARLARPDFVVTEENSVAVAEICRRLDGMPLAIELAAARVRALSLAEIVASLHDRFRLLTGGARTAVRRQQTLRASVDWSHALLTEPERVLLRRLAAFLGGFDLEAAQVVAGGGELQRYQVLDQLTLLVDKSLVVAEDTEGRTRYRLLETVRQYALEKLGESGESDEVRTRHRDHYNALAVQLDTAGRTTNALLLAQVETEIDNLRAAFAWSRERSETESALVLASSLQRLWTGRGRLREGMSWFDSVIADAVRDDPAVSAAVRARALAENALIHAWMGEWGVEDSIRPAQQALDIARAVGDRVVSARALTACCYTGGFTAEVAVPYFTEAVDLARALGDEWTLSQILTWQGLGAFVAGDATAISVAAEEGRDLAIAIGSPFDSRMCRLYLAWAQMWRGGLTEAIGRFGQLAAESDAVGDAVAKAIALQMQVQALAYRGDICAADAGGRDALHAAGEAGGIYLGVAYCAVTNAALAAGDVAAAAAASRAGWPDMSLQPDVAATFIAPMVQVALAEGDLSTALRLADDAVGTTNGWHKMVALTLRSRVAMAQGQFGQAERDLHAALVCGAEVQAALGIPDVIDCLAAVAADAGNQREAVRLFGAASAMRQRTGEVRFRIYQADYDASIAALRDALGESDFASVWDEGAALSWGEAIAYAQRGRGERKRPATGWASLTPTELDVVRLVNEGLSNKDIGTRLFVSPRTVQTHLTHVYNKLGLTSRMQLAQESARHR